MVLVTQSRKNFLHTNLITAQKVQVDAPISPTQIATNGPIVSLPIAGSSKAVGIATQYSDTSSVSAGNGAYAANAAWPMPRGTSNTMAATSTLPGPGATGAAVPTVIAATSGKDFSKSTIAVDANNNTYAVAQIGSNAVLYKYDAAFTELWAYTVVNIAFTGVAYAFSVVLGANGAVYFLTSGGLHSVDAATGVANWVNPLRNTNFYTLSNIVLDVQGNIVCSTGCTLFCISADNTILWTTFLLQQIGSLALDPVTGILYAVTYAAFPANVVNQVTLTRFNTATGVELMTPETSKSVFLSGQAISDKMTPPVIGTQYIYMFTGRALVAYTKQCETVWAVPVWVYRSNNVVNTFVYNSRLNRIYVTGMIDNSTSGTTTVQTVFLTAINGTTGARLATSALTGTSTTILASVQPVIDGNNNLYLYESSNNFRVFDQNLTLLRTLAVTVTFGYPPPFALTTNAKLLAATSTGIFQYLP